MAFTGWIGPAIQGTAGIAQAGFGIYQHRKATKALEALERPEYEIPPEIFQNLTAAQQQALEGLPAAQKQEFVENVQRSIQSGQAALQERGLGVAGISSLAQTEQDAMRGLLTADVGARREGQAGVARARTTIAGFKEREFDINLMQPYIQEYLEKQGLLGAGTQNIMGGFGTLAESGANMAGAGGGGGFMSMIGQ